VQYFGPGQLRLAKKISVGSIRQALDYAEDLFSRFGLPARRSEKGDAFQPEHNAVPIRPVLERVSQ
jgi:hypothetical protein